METALCMCVFGMLSQRKLACLRRERLLIRSQARARTTFATISNEFIVAHSKFHIA